MKEAESGIFPNVEIAEIQRSDRHDLRVVGGQISNDSGRIPRDHCVGRDLAADHALAADNGATTDSRSGQDDRAESYPDIVLDHDGTGCHGRLNSSGTLRRALPELLAQRRSV